MVCNVDRPVGEAKLQDIKMKTCSVEDLCVSGSINMGIVKVTNNAQCCSTNLCNSGTPPGKTQHNTPEI